VEKEQKAIDASVAERHEIKSAVQDIYGLLKSAELVMDPRDGGRTFYPRQAKEKNAPSSAQVTVQVASSTSTSSVPPPSSTSVPPPANTPKKTRGTTAATDEHGPRTRSASKKTTFLEPIESSAPPGDRLDDLRKEDAEALILLVG